MKLIALIIAAGISFTSCKQKDSGEVKLKLEDSITRYVKTELKDKNNNECNLKDSLRLRFENFNNNSTAKSAYEIMKFIQKYDIDIVQSKCSLLTLEDWFTNNAGVSFIQKIEHLNIKDNNFNGVEYLYKIRNLYSSDAEMDELMSNITAKMAYDYPVKFIKALENIGDKEKFLLYPFWETIDVRKFREKVFYSKNYQLIDSVLLNYN